MKRISYTIRILKKHISNNPGNSGTVVTGFFFFFFFFFFLIENNENVQTLVLQNARLLTFCAYEGGSESSVIGVITLSIDMIGCCIIP